MDGQVGLKIGTPCFAIPEQAKQLFRHATGLGIDPSGIGDASTAMNGGASLSLQTGRLAPETGDVQRSVDVPMMFETAIATHPLPDPESFQPSRAADASARRTGSGCIRFVHF